MVSEPKGLMYIPVWVDDGVIKALVLDDGSLPVTESTPLTSIQARLYGDLNDVWEKVHVLSDGSLRVFIGGAADDTEVIQGNPDSLKVGTHGYDGSAWKKQGLVWAYNDVLHESWVENDSAAGALFHSFGTVPSGEVWVITHAMAFNMYTNPDYIFWSIYDGSNYHTFRRTAGPGIGVEVNYSGLIPIKEGEKCVVWYGGCVLHDVLEASIWGYKMKVDM